MSRILVVDDEEGVRSFVAEALDLDGHSVDQADGGPAALALLRKREYDLLITDLKMPGMSGIELLDAARGEQPSLQVIVLTAHGSVEVAVDAMKRGALDFIQKPVSGPAELRLLARRALEHRRLLAVADRAARDADDDAPLSYGDPAMAPVVDALRKVARTSSTVLLVGESGTGKEVAARAVHQWSPRADGPFVAINCAALSENLLESELFGHERGAFTGADSQRRGRIELADGGTFFLDEVGELEPALQAKLLRVIQERSFVRVGGSRTIDVDVRWIAATNRDLHEMIESGAFREDLFHRLAVFPVRMPALRDRAADLAPLAARLLERVAAQLGRPGLRLADDARSHIARAAWPGNVRELANALERAAILADGDEIRAEHLWMNPLGPAPGARAAAATGGLTLAEMEERAIRDALDAAGGSVKDAAVALGIPRRTLYDKLKKYEIG